MEQNTNNNLSAVCVEADATENVQLKKRSPDTELPVQPKPKPVVQ